MRKLRRRKHIPSNKQGGVWKIKSVHQIGKKHKRNTRWAHNDKKMGFMKPSPSDNYTAVVIFIVRRPHGHSHGCCELSCHRCYLEDWYHSACCHKSGRTTEAVHIIWRHRKKSPPQIRSASKILVGAMDWNPIDGWMNVRHAGGWKGRVTQREKLGVKGHEKRFSHSIGLLCWRDFNMYRYALNVIFFVLFSKSRILPSNNYAFIWARTGA